MKDYLPKNGKQATSLVLYLLFAILAAFRKPLLLILLFVSHCCEYLFIARPMAVEKNIKQSDALIHTLLYGFTWWKPIKEEK